MSCDCGCCTGARATTPIAEENRPGLCKISHRPGTYASFVETMHARLSSTDFPELAPLRMRDPGDASIALCDAWAISADVLSFYQDRIANEGYLRTATERNSVLQLGRLTGYKLRPGVSASVYLAYTIDANASPVTIPIGTRAQSVPAAGEKMQTFETAEPLSARPDWSQIAVRQAQPQWRDPQPAATASAAYRKQYDVLQAGVYLQGTNSQLKTNDALLIDYGDGTQTPYRVDSIAADSANQRTLVSLRAWNAPAAKLAIARRAAAAVVGQRLTPLAAMISDLSKPLTVQPRNALSVSRNVATTLQAGAETYSRMLLTHLPLLRDTLVPALRTINATRSAPTQIKVYALRIKAAVFGNNAPASYLDSISSGAKATDPPIISYAQLSLDTVVDREGQSSTELPLDAKYEQIKPGSDGADPSYIIVDPGMQPGGSALPAYVRKVLDNQTTSKSIGVTVSAQVSQLTVDSNWLPVPVQGGGEINSFYVLRNTQIYAQSEQLELAADPLLDDVTGDASGNELELDKYYDGLTPGQWMIAGGERADFADPGIKVEVAERAMIAAVRHGLTSLGDSGENLPGDTLHTYITLAAPLAYSYRRATFTLYGNVARATHGETRKETLGAGDATQIFQQFALKSPPLTYVAAPTVEGVASTLQVRVNNLLWHEDEDVSAAAPSARDYLTRRDDSEATSVVFGDGKHGARLPTGQDNVAAVYRCGIGAAGNVRAGQLTLAADKPLGVTGVDNPIRASGGADPDTLQQARVNAPLAVTALDRLVSVQDYADFACTFAGIGKATATKLPAPGGDFVQVTIAGIDDIPIDKTSDLYLNLVTALHAFGDPHMPIRVDIRTALSLVIQANVSLQPDYAWDDVQPQIQAALYRHFGFQARALGQPVFGSEIIGVIQSVAGVAHVPGGSVRLLSDADLINGLTPLPPAGDPTQPKGQSNGSSSAWFTLSPVPKTTDEGDGANGWLNIPAAYIDGAGNVQPAQIAYLPPDVPYSLILELAS